jgi:hypothetical protein
MKYLIVAAVVAAGVYVFLSNRAEQERAAHAEAVHLSSVAWQGYHAAVDAYRACVEAYKASMCEGEKANMEMHKEDARVYTAK